MTSAHPLHPLYGRLRIPKGGPSPGPFTIDDLLEDSRKGASTCAVPVFARMRA